MSLARLAISFAVAVAIACSSRPAGQAPLPGVIPHATWQAQPPAGHAADAMRRNKRAGDSITFRELTVTVRATSVDSSGTTPVDMVQLTLAAGRIREERTLREGAAFNWHGYHVAIVAVYGPGELGAGLVALEVATVSSLQSIVSASETAGGADLRLRIPHRIQYVTLHHTGDARILAPTDDAAQRLRNLQSWGAAERNWWDVPYHFLLGLNGSIYEGRDWHFMGETNTTYDPSGHFLISMIGNYDQQQPTQAQLDAIADMMAWAIKEFDLPLDRIGGHYNYADTDCPGRYLRPYLEDGTFKRMVAARLKGKSR